MLTRAEGQRSSSPRQPITMRLGASVASRCEAYIPMLRDKRLRAACAALLHEPGRPETLEEWSDIAGASSQNLTLRSIWARPVVLKLERPVVMLIAALTESP
jgi:hypothetical protein